MDGLHNEFSNFDPYITNNGFIEEVNKPTLSEEDVVRLILGAAQELDITSEDQAPQADQPAEESHADYEATLNSSLEPEEPLPPEPAGSDGPIKPPTEGGGEIGSGEDDDGGSNFGEGYEGYTRPTDRPELAQYLHENSGVDPASVLVGPHIPRLIGGIESTQFIIQAPEATPDTPPDPDEVIDLRTTVLPASELKNFSNFFDTVEAQADAQYEVALLETQQIIADAEERGATIDTIFVPDSPNETASGYFQRLTRLAQDTNKTVVIHVVDYEDNYRFERFKSFEPIRATSAEDYWNEREREMGPRRQQGIEPEPSDQDTIDALQGLTMPPEDYWENRDEYEVLHSDLNTVAAANPEKLQSWLLEDTSPTGDKLSVIKEVALSTTDSLRNARGPARIIMAKIGDPDTLQQILHEITTKTGGASWESHTINPLGIYMRSDKPLLNAVLENVEEALDRGPNEPYELLSWLGALYHSFDPAIGPTLANHLKVPEHHAQTYAANALHAAGRWMPLYTQVLSAMPPSAQRDTALAAIQERTQAFLDAYNEGRLDGIYQSMMYWPADYLAPMLFGFRNPEHQSTLKECVLTQFKQGGSVLNDSGFEHLYLLYRQQYGDLPEITRHIHTTN